MRVGEEQIAVSDRRVAAILRGARMDRHELAENVVVADGRRRRLAAILAVLRNLADRCELEDAIARAEARPTGDHGVRPDDAPGADRHTRADDRIGADLDVDRELSGWVDQRGRMDA